MITFEPSEREVLRALILARLDMAEAAEASALYSALDKIQSQPEVSVIDLDERVLDLSWISIMGLPETIIEVVVRQGRALVSAETLETMAQSIIEAEIGSPEDDAGYAAEIRAIPARPDGMYDVTDQPGLEDQLIEAGIGRISDAEAESVDEADEEALQLYAIAEFGGGWEPDCGGQWVPIDASRQTCLKCGIVRAIPDDCSGEHEGCSGGHLRHLRAYEVSRRVEIAKREILADVEAGRVKRTASSFSELHDYVDANYYGEGYPMLDAAMEVNGEDWSEPEAETDVMNAIQDTVDEWLKRGGLAFAVVEEARGDGLSLDDLDALFVKVRAEQDAERAAAEAR